MNRVLAAAAEIQGFCEAEGWHFCFIGGIAVQRWGEPRNTQDADLTLITGFGREEHYVDRLLSAFAARRQDARDFALRYRVLLLHAANGVPLDVAMGAMPFEERSVERSVLWRVGGVELRVCRAEDLIVHKVFAGRVRDWLDIEGVWLRQGAVLNQKQIWDELLPLLELKEDTESAARLRAIFAG